jgi:hypothetical protein
VRRCVSAGRGPTCSYLSPRKKSGWRGTRWPLSSTCRHEKVTTWSTQRSRGGSRRGHMAVKKGFGLASMRSKNSAIGMPQRTRLECSRQCQSPAVRVQIVTGADSAPCTWSRYSASRRKIGHSTTITTSTVPMPHLESELRSPHCSPGVPRYAACDGVSHISSSTYRSSVIGLLVDV